MTYVKSRVCVALSWSEYYATRISYEGSAKLTEFRKSKEGDGDRAYDAYSSCTVVSAEQEAMGKSTSGLYTRLIFR
jgi:hypothetical protein